MAKALYMDDSYLKKWNAEVKSVSKDKFIILDKTAFFPRGGGVEWDTGTIINEDKKVFNVVYTGKFSGEISHEVEKKGLIIGNHGIGCWSGSYRYIQTERWILSRME